MADFVCRQSFLKRASHLVLQRRLETGIKIVAMSKGMDKAKYLSEELYQRVFSALAGFWYEVQDFLWAIVAVLTFEYENYWILRHCRFVLGVYRIYVDVYLYLFENLTPEEAKKNRYPEAELAVGYCLEGIPEIKAQLNEVNTRVFAWLKRRCMKVLSELEAELQQLEEKIRYGWHLEKLIGAYQSARPNSRPQG